MTIDHTVLDAGGTSESGDAPEPVAARARPHWVDRFDRRLVLALTVVGFAIPVIAYLWFVVHYSINTVVGDQWDDITVIHNSYLHGFDFSSLWAQHNENRILFPNLIVLLLSRTTHFDVRIEQFLSAGLLLASVSLIIASHRRRAALPLLYYCPVVIVMLSFVQWSNTTWGFQMAWYLVLFASTAALFLLDVPHLRPWTFGLAILAGIVASYSSIQGLIVWPVGLVLLYYRKRGWAHLAAWLATGIVVALLYFHNYSSSGTATNNSIIEHHPLRAVKSYLFSIGDILGFPLRFNQPGSPWILTFGGVLVLLAFGLIILYGLRRDTRSGRPVGIAVLLVGLLFDAMITQGRIGFGYFGASASRYTTYDLLVLVGIYLVLLERSPRADSPVEPTSPVLDRFDSTMARLGRWADQRLLAACRVLILAAIALQLAFGIPNGLINARSNYVYQAAGPRVMRNIAHEPDAFVAYYLDPFLKPGYLRKQVRILKQYHLSLFGSAPGTSHPRAGSGGRGLANLRTAGDLALPSVLDPLPGRHHELAAEGKSGTQPVE